MPKNPRQKKLDAIMSKIAHFIVEETFTDEGDQQEKLGKVIKTMEEVSQQLVKNDDAHAAKKEAEFIAECDALAADAKNKLKA